MSEILSIFIFVLPRCLISSWATYDQFEKEADKEYDGVRYRPMIINNMLLVTIIMVFILVLFFHGSANAIDYSFSVLFCMFISITAYYTLLIVLLPILRRYINSRTCALLWLLPNIMYAFFNNYNKAIFANPWAVINIPDKFIKPVAIIWALGFVAIMVWKIVGHFVFKKQLLKNVTPITEDRVLNILTDEISRAGIKYKLKIFKTADIITPVSIGSGDRAKIILPDRYYSEEELRLIFRHEIIHIGRDDGGAKFFMTFCTALCWFNPLVWYAMEKSAEDAELSCDETVLLGESDDTRKLYAHLILENAGDGRGFTTCLSASAESMRYRLKSIVKPTKKHYGTLLSGVMILALFASFGRVAIAYGHSDLGKKLSDLCDIEKMEFSFAHSYYNDVFNRELICEDTTALIDYISALKVAQTTASFPSDESQKDINLFYNTPDGICVVGLYDDHITVKFLNDIENDHTYYLCESLDWDYLERLVISYPAVNVQLKNDKADNIGMIGTQTLELYLVENGEEKPIIQEDYYGAGLYGHNDIHIAEIRFSDQLAGDYTIDIQSWDYSEGYTKVMKKDENTLNIYANAAHYTVRAEFIGKNGDIYRGVFRFDISDTAE